MDAIVYRRGLAGGEQTADGEIEPAMEVTTSPPPTSAPLPSFPQPQLSLPQTALQTHANSGAIASRLMQRPAHIMCALSIILEYFLESHLKAILQLHAKF